MHSELGAHGAHANFGRQKGELLIPFLFIHFHTILFFLNIPFINPDESPEDQVPYANKKAASPPPSGHVKRAAKSGLSAAAVKAKLFGDQEECEIQRLAATIINHKVCVQANLLLLCGVLSLAIIVSFIKFL